MIPLKDVNGFIQSLVKGTTAPITQISQLYYLKLRVHYERTISSEPIHDGDEIQQVGPVIQGRCPRVFQS